MSEMAKPRVEALLAVIRDECRPSSARFKAAVVAAPLCHEPLAPVVVTTTGPPISRAEWLAAGRAHAIGDRGK